MDKVKILAIVGPTGVGKTEISLSVAKKLETEIISCDSMQIYRYMDIGTAKPTPGQQKIVRHHLLDVVDPDQNYDAAEYRKDAGMIIQKLVMKNKIPLVVGGTGFYLRALVDGLFDHPKIPKQFREEVLNKCSNLSNTLIYQELAKVDPVSAGKIHPNDRKRILRALEVFEYTGTAISVLQKEQQEQKPPYDPLLIGLTLPRKQLYDRINQRVVDMFKNGWVEEVKNLRDRGYSPELQSMQSLGYKYINQFLDGNCSEKEMVERTQRDTRRYAKRQYTWFNADNRIEWVDISRQSVSKTLESFFARIKFEVLEG